MPTRFLLPDLCDIYDPWNGNTRTHANVPCRQIPMWFRTTSQLTGNYWYSPTHWIDFNVIAGLRDGYVFIPDPIVVAYTPKTRIQMILEGELTKFILVFLEKRYTNTPDNYMRAYCRRMAPYPL